MRPMNFKIFFSLIHVVQFLKVHQRNSRFENMKGLHTVKPLWTVHFDQ